VNGFQLTVQKGSVRMQLAEPWKIRMNLRLVCSLKR
jgi:hypothetical protein